MKTNKEYRFKDNPKEKEFHDKFIEMFESNYSSKTTLSAIIFGWKDDYQTTPTRYLTDDEQNICLNLIQWLGSPVGKGFLDQCGFVNKDNSKCVSVSQICSRLESMKSGIDMPAFDHSKENDTTYCIEWGIKKGEKISDSIIDRYINELKNL